jgi:hypothetical protein
LEGLKLISLQSLVKFLNFLIKSMRGIHPNPLFLFIPFQGGKALRVLNDHPFQKRPLWQLGPEWNFGEVFKDEPEDFLLVLMREGSDSCCDERVLKFHSFS